MPAGAPVVRNSKGSKDTLVLAHLSDPHLSSLKGARVGDLLNKRVLGYLSWRLGRRREHRAEILSALLQDLKTTDPDHIAITGDLTHVGLPCEFQAAKQWLAAVGPPTKVTLVPGNHDAYVGDDWHRTFALWEEYMRSDSARSPTATEEDFRNAFPILRVRGQTALIGISTAHPSPPFLAVGRMGQAQLDKLEKILANTARQGLLRVVLIHHPPLPGLITWRKRLTDAGQLRSLLERQGAQLVLHGHGHRHSLTQFDTPRGRVTTVGVPSASAFGRKPERRARYHVFRLAQGGQGWDVLVSARRYSFAQGRFVGENEFRLTVDRISTGPALEVPLWSSYSRSFKS